MIRRRLVLLLLGIAPLAHAGQILLAPIQSLDPANTTAAQDAVNHLLAQTTDAAVLLRAAQILRVKYVDAPVNTLEYWGTDTRTQDELRRSADTLLHLLAAARNLARRQADALVGSMSNATDASNLVRWKQLSAQVAAVEEQNAFVNYARLLAAEPEGKMEWKERALETEKAIDANDPLLIGKLFLAAGDSKEARAAFQKLLTNPAGDIVRQYQARYFLCIADLIAGQFDRAHADRTELVAWQKRELAGDNHSATNGADAAAAILEYRIDCAQADASDLPDQKTRYDTSAIAALQGLAKEQPDLKPEILKYLGQRYADRTQIPRAAQPLLLEALMQRGAATDADARALANAQHAAQIILDRGGEFSRPTVDYAAALSAAILDRTGQRSAAAQAYFALARRLENRNVPVATAALNRSIKLFQQTPADALPADAYEQALSMALGKPFNRTDLFYAYGELLVQHGRLQAAQEAFRRVAPDDPRFADAELARMICIERSAKTAPTGAGDNSPAQMDSLANDILRRSPAASARAAQAILLSAQFSQLVHNPQASLAKLQDLPVRCQGLPNEQKFIDRGDELRIEALLEMNRPAEAVSVLAGNHDHVAISVSSLTQQLDSAFDQSQNSDQRAAMASARVTFGEWLLNHSAGTSAAEMNGYRLFLANSLRSAGELENNPRARQKDLEKSLRLFRQLPSSNASGVSDSVPLLGEAGVQFDLHDYAAARQILLPLLDAGQLGDGQGPAADAYWEATYELIASNLAMARANRQPAEETETIAFLKRLYIQWGNQTGGAHWHERFETLRRAALANERAASETSDEPAH